MASTKITFEDKVSTITSQLPRKNRITVLHKWNKKQP